MRTNIVLNEKLVKEGLKYVTVKTKKSLIDTALREFIANHRRRDIRELKGKIQILDDYQYKTLRKGE